MLKIYKMHQQYCKLNSNDKRIYKAITKYTTSFQT